MESTARSVQRPTRGGIVALLLAAAALAAAPAVSAAAKPPKGAPKAAAPAPAPAADANQAAPKADPGVPGQPQPPDGKWLKDKKTGQEYFLDKLPKEGGHFIRLSDNKVRTAWGIVIEVVKEDDQYFYYRVYKAGSGTGPTAPPKPKPEELQKIAESYQVDTAESQRLRFVPFSTGLPTAGQWRNGFDIADMNEDGHPDIVHSPARKGISPPVIFLGDGKGTWRRWNEARFPNLPYDYGDAAVGDFNGDGHMDIALGVHLRGLMAITGDGKGNFKDAGKGLDFVLPGPGREAGFSSRTVMVADWNGDGRPDIIAVGEGPRVGLPGPGKDAARVVQNTESYGVVVYLNQGDGTWKRQDQGTSGREIFSDALVIGDFNGDRRKDFATGSSIMGRASLVNFGRADGGWSPTDVALLRPQSYVESVDALDVDGDGLDDLVVGYMSFQGASWRSGIDIFYAHKDGSWTRRALAVREERTEFSALAHGDLDGDGKADLVALTSNGETFVFLGDGKGYFTRETATGIKPFLGGCRGYHVRVADLDGDGKGEIVSDFAGEASAMADPDRCPSGGGMQAWHLAPASASMAPAPKPPGGH